LNFFKSRKATAVSDKAAVGTKLAAVSTKVAAVSVEVDLFLEVKVNCTE
jgi:hypothetical protein